MATLRTIAGGIIGREIGAFGHSSRSLCRFFELGSRERDFVQTCLVGVAPTLKAVYQKAFAAFLFCQLASKSVAVLCWQSSDLLPVSWSMRIQGTGDTNR